MTKKNKHMYIQLEGGIGNQLFQISAGEFYSKKMLRKAIYKIPLNNYLDNDINEFTLLLSKSCEIYKNNILNYKVFRYIWKIDRKLIKIFQWYSLLRKVSDFKNMADTRKIIMPHDVREIRGYFQSSIYAQESRKLILLILKNTKISLEAKELIVKSKTESPVGVHIRRGDFLKFEKLYGLLSIEYYEKIIKKIIAKNPNQIFWIFSNDIEKVQHDFSQSRFFSNFIFVVINI